MVSIDLTPEEVKVIISLMDNSQVPISKAEEALKLYKKFKEAKD